MELKWQGVWRPVCVMVRRPNIAHLPMCSIFLRTRLRNVDEKLMKIKNLSLICFVVCDVFI